MVELPLVFVGGLLGSAHCLGMCGGFALLIGAAAPHWSHNLGRQVIYSGGRIFSYSVLGAAVGYGGLRLSDQFSTIVNVQAMIAIAAGLFLIAQGLPASGVLRHLRPVLSWAGAANGSSTRAGADLGCLMGGLVGTYLRDPRRSHVFLAGVFTGLLPCGLVYAFVTLAASTSDPLQASATMAAFGLGTVPMMVLAGTGSAFLSLAGRKRLMTAAAWCVVLMGLISLARGVSFLSQPEAPPAARCPLCE